MGKFMFVLSIIKYYMQLNIFAIFDTKKSHIYDCMFILNNIFLCIKLSLKFRMRNNCLILEAFGSRICTNILEYGVFRKDTHAAYRYITNNIDYSVSNSKHSKKLHKYYFIITTELKFQFFLLVTIEKILK